MYKVKIKSTDGRIIWTREYTVPKGRDVEWDIDLAADISQDEGHCLSTLVKSCCSKTVLDIIG